jgi:hypothetical protein
MDENITLPNLLIVGAAKCGTTSLHNYLKQHPDIFMTEHKEPHFLINSEIGERRVHKAVTTLETYEKMFETEADYKYKGESSVMYLAFPEFSIKNIKKYLDPDVKIIIMLRNPIERAFAGYLHNVRYNTSENLSFEEAIEKSEERYQKTNDMTPDTRYLHVGMYYNQVKKYMDEFGKNVHVVIYDDYVSNINGSIKRVFDFLKVNNIEMDTSQRHMVGGWIFKNPILRKLMISKNGLKSFVKLLLPSSSLRKKIRTIIMRFGTSKTPELTTKMRKYLEDYYRDDIAKLENLIDKDLNWNK